MLVQDLIIAIPSHLGQAHQILLHLGDESVFLTLTHYTLLFFLSLVVFSAFLELFWSILELV
jgi:hypothetical protein